jgi:hypothetical protein
MQTEAIFLLIIVNEVWRVQWRGASVCMKLHASQGCICVGILAGARDEVRAYLGQTSLTETYESWSSGPASFNS